MIPPGSCGRLPDLNPISRTPVRATQSPALWILLYWYFCKRPFLRRRALRTFNSCWQLNTTGNGQIIIIYMVSYCDWNKHNNLSSRALVWHTYHHDVFAYMSEHLKDRYIAVRKEETIQADLPSSVVRKWAYLLCVHCAIRPSASLTRHDRHVKGGSAHETQNKAEDCFSLQGDITGQSEARWSAFSAFSDI